MMKVKSVSIYKLLLGTILCILVFSLAGCGVITGVAELFHQPGETAAEGHRRHLRNLSVNQQNMAGDLDRALLFDRPSRAHDRIID